MGTGWSGIDSFYFAMATVITVGSGDVTPESDSAKLFTIFFAIFGIGIVGKALGDVTAWFLLKQKELTQNAAAKMVAEAEKAAKRVGSSASKAARSVKRSAEALEVAKSCGQPIADPQPAQSTRLPEPTTSRQQVADFVSFKAVSSHYYNRAKHYLAIVLPVFVFILTGLILGDIEDWPVLDSIYYACITITTVGYGDISPQTSAGRVFAVFFLPLGVLAVTNTLRVLAESHLMAKAKASESSPARMLQKVRELQRSNKAAGGDGTLTESQYILHMVVSAMELVSDDTVFYLRSQFRILDRDGTGLLDADDLVNLSVQLAAGGGSGLAGLAAAIKAQAARAAVAKAKSKMMSKVLAARLTQKAAPPSRPRPAAEAAKAAAATAAVADARRGTSTLTSTAMEQLPPPRTHASPEPPHPRPHPNLPPCAMVARGS